MYERGPSGNITGYAPQAVRCERPNAPVQQIPQPTDAYRPEQQLQAVPVQSAPPQPSFPQASQNAAVRSGGGFFSRRSMLLLVSAALCTLYLIFCHQTVGGMLEAAPAGESAEELGAALGTMLGAALLTPFMWISFVGQLFNWFGWGFNRRGLALTGAILYCVALLLGFSWGLGLIPSIVLSFMGYARLRRGQQADRR